MSTPAALLNKMASTSGSSSNTRKRQRESSGATASPSKRRGANAEHREEEIGTNAAEAASSFTRKSKTRLSRPSLPLPATLALVTRRRADNYEVPESPEKTKEKDAEQWRKDSGKPAAKPKNVMRKVGEKKAQNKSPFKGRGFEGLGELDSDARLTSFDSPAKNTRSRPKNPLDVLRLRNLQKRDDTGRDSQKEGRNGKLARVRINGREQDEGSDAPSKAISWTSDRNGAAPEEVAEEIENLENRETKSPVGRDDETDEDEDEGPGQQLQQEIRRMEQETSSPKKATSSNQKQIGASRDNSSDQAAVGASAPLGQDVSANFQRQERRPAPAENGENVRETEASATEQDQPEASQRGRGPPAISQEERQARREAEAHKRAENALETENAELADFEKRALKFVQGIEDTVERIGGIEAWSRIGGGAKTITAMVARKTDMETERCQSVWRQARKLSKWFKGLEEADEEEVVQTLKSLQARATWKHLSRDGETRRGDQAVIEIYEHLIPQSVYLIKNALKGRFNTNYRHSWQEMLMLVDIAMTLCKAASEWEPKPSMLEGGIRREVRNHIRPGLNDIREALRTHLDRLELKERNKRRAEELERAQKKAKLMRQKQWEALQARMSSCRLSPQSGAQPNCPRYEEEVVDIDELDNEGPYHSTGVKATQSRPRMARQATEEIPAPDPIVTWTEQEQIALLNGLQRFRGADRYDRILETSIELNMKDIDQCMARARYHKQACRQLLAEEAAKGGHGYDWLRSV